MDAGAYRETILIEKSRAVSDSIANRSLEWSEYFRGYAYINNLSGTERWAAAQVRAENTVVFSIRYHPLLAEMNTKGFRIVHRGRVYNISSIDNVQYKNDIVKIRAMAKE